MKKLLSAVFALTIGVTCTASLAACGDDKDGVNYTEVVNGAIDQVKEMYGKASYNETDASFAVLGKTQYNGIECAITWTVSQEVATYMSVGTELDSDNKVTISVNSRPEADVAYKLTATATAGNESAKHEFSRTLKGQKVSDIMSVAQVLALDTTKVIEIKNGKNTFKYYSEDGTTAKVVTVKGYVVDPGTWSSQYSNFSDIYIVDEYSDAKNKNSDDALQVYRIKPDSVFLKGEGDVCRGDLITFEGCLQVYSGKFEMSYCGDVNVTCKNLEQDKRTDEQRAEAALNEVEFESTVIADIVLAKPSFRGVTLSMTSSNTAVIANDGKVTRPAADASDATVTITVTAKCGEATKNKQFVITVKKLSNVVAGNPATVTFAAANRDKFEADQVTFISGGATVTLDKASSSTACNNGNYTADELRAYKGTNFKIEYTGITKIVFHSSSVGRYTADLESNLKAAFPNAAISVVGHDITIEFDAAVNEVLIAMSVGQARIVSIDINPAA